MDMVDEGRKVGLDKALREIQSAIEEEEAHAFSRVVLEEARAPPNLRAMDGADGKSSITGACGDTIHVFLRLDEGRIVDASFLTDGCGTTLACGSMLTKMARGMTVGEAMALSDSDLLEALGGLPDENLHCARLAVAALHRAANLAEDACKARGASDRVASARAHGLPVTVRKGRRRKGKKGVRRPRPARKRPSRGKRGVGPR